MAKARPSYDENKLGIKVSGDIGSNFQIVEETSGCAVETLTADTSVSNIPSNLLQGASAPMYGSVSVKKSENVQFGNNTYFNGPVTIKQVIHKCGVDNASYVRTDGDDVSPSHSKAEPKEATISSTKSFEILLWHKLTFSAICLIIIGGICAVLSVVISNNRGSSVSNYHSAGDSDTRNTMVVGSSYEYFQIIVLTITLISLIFLLISNFLLTKEISVANNIKPKEHVTCYVNKYYNMNIKNHHKTEGDPLLIAPNHLRIVSRTDWLAQPIEGELDPIRQPVPWVIITHTATESCSKQSECVLRVRLIQTFHIESKKWFDIGYNFLVAGDGSAYYGRGWDDIGAHTLGYNKYSIGIAFIGTFNNEAPPVQQLEACEKLIKRGVELGKLAKDYKLFAHRQLASTLSPGDKLFDIIKEWPHFVNNFTDISELLPHY